MSGWTTAGKRSYEKKTPEKTHIGIITRLIKPLTLSIFLRTAGGEKAETGKGRRAERSEQQDCQPRSDHAHMEDKDAEAEQQSQFQDHQHETTARERQQEITAAHGCGYVALQ